MPGVMARVHVGHHIVDGLGAVEAVAPSQCGIGPVDGHNDLVGAFADPVFYVCSVDGGINRSGNADRIDGHRINVGVPPVVICFIVGAVDNDAGSGVGPFLEVTIVEGLSHTGIHNAVIGAAPVVARGDGESAAAGIEVDVIQVISVHSVAEARVCGGDVGHHIVDGLGAVEAVAPSQRGVGPVDSHNNLVGAFANPVNDVAGSNGSLIGSGRTVRILDIG